MSVVKSDQSLTAQKIADLDLGKVQGPAVAEPALPSLDRNRVEVNKNLHQQAYKETLAVLRSLDKSQNSSSASGPQKEAMRQLKRQLPKIATGLSNAQAAVEEMSANPQFAPDPREFAEANKVLREVQKLTSKARKLV